jgi:hypothetical protein
MKTFRSAGLTLLLVLGLLLPLAFPVAAAPVSGAIFTTGSACDGTNLNIFAELGAVYLDGGPVQPGAAGLPDGWYWVKVTEPDGTLLGNTTTASVQVVNGEFVHCYRLWDILVKASDGTQGYDVTGNPGGVYKVWVSQNGDFPQSASKTDNFKVLGGGVEPEVATLNVIKFYDANANGINDDGQLITGWKVRIQNGIDVIRYTPVSMIVEAGSYTVSEFMPEQGNWQATTPTSVGVTLAAGETATVAFGNLCLGAGGGHTLGFWSNRTGQRLIGDDDLALLVGLNLRNADGSHFDPATNAAFRTWLLGGNATNMAYMLSVQLAAMELNVFNGSVSSDALIYAPGTTSANALGYATVGDVLAEANAELGLNGLTLADHASRGYQEALKNALDAANNNLNFVQAGPCPFTFED